MQLFMPYPDVYRSAAVLDPVRLGKQRLEAYECATAARRHPCVDAWQGAHTLAAHFGLACCMRYAGFRKRDGTPYDTERMLVKLLPLAPGKAEHAPTPWWWGDDAVHTLYQRWLVRKDPAFYGPVFDVEPLDVADFPWEVIVPGWVRR